MVLAATRPVITRDNVERELFNNIDLVMKIPISLGSQLVVTPNVISDHIVEMCGCRIDLRSCIYQGATANDTINGYQRLQAQVGNNAFLLYYMREISELNTAFGNYKSKKIMAWMHEPVSAIILRLSYWYAKCVDIGLLEGKGKDVHDKLRVKNGLLNEIKNCGNSIKVNEKLSQINTTISELCVASLVSDLEREVSFVKDHEFLIDNLISEVKTIHPDFDNLTKFKISANQMKKLDLKHELLKYLNRPEIKINHLKKAVECQSAEIVFLNITFSYERQLIQWLMYLEETGLDLSFSKALADAIEIQGTKNKVLPLVVIIGSISFDYEIYAVTLEIPIIQDGTSRKLR